MKEIQIERCRTEEGRIVGDVHFFFRISLLTQKLREIYRRSKEMKVWFPRAGRALALWEGNGRMRCYYEKRELNE